MLLKDRSDALLSAPDARTAAGKRDRAMRVLLHGWTWKKDLSQREGRWVFADMAGKGKRIRTVTVPAGVKAGID